MHYETIDSLGICCLGVIYKVYCSPIGLAKLLPNLFGSWYFCHNPLKSVRYLMGVIRWAHWCSLRMASGRCLSICLSKQRTSWGRLWTTCQMSILPVCGLGLRQTVEIPPPQKVLTFWGDFLFRARAWPYSSGRLSCLGCMFFGGNVVAHSISRHKWMIEFACSEYL